jgi:hypothetical protein
MVRNPLKVCVVQLAKMRLHVAMRLNGQFHLNTTGLYAYGDRIIVVLVSLLFLASQMIGVAGPDWL